MRSALFPVAAMWFLIPTTAAGEMQIDMKRNILFKKQLNSATESVKQYLVKETKLAGVPVRIDLGNEGAVSVKSAILRAEQLHPLTGKAELVFDLHFRHVVMRAQEKIVLGQKVSIPAVIAYDRHEDLVVEYDIGKKNVRVRVLKGSYRLPHLPEQEYEVWIKIDLRQTR